MRITRIDVEGNQAGNYATIARRQVAGARSVQRGRFGAGSTTTNATMPTRQIRRYCKLCLAGESLLKQAMTELGLSARAHDKVLRIGRTIADLDAAESIAPHHLAEAICTRGILAAAFWQRVCSAA